MRPTWCRPVPQVRIEAAGVAGHPPARTRHNAPMIPKPLQFVLLLPLAFGAMAPRFFVGLFLLALVGLALWWLRLVLAVLLGD